MNDGLVRERTTGRGFSHEELLARMLCYGVKLPEGVPDWFTQKYDLEPGFVQGAVLMYAGRRPVNTAIFDAMTLTGKAIELYFSEGSLYVKRDAMPITCNPLAQPSIVSEHVAPYGRIGAFVRLHAPNVLFGVPVRQCIFGANGKACQFCTYDMSTPLPLPPTIFASMYKRVAEQLDKTPELALGAGTPNLRDHGLRYFAQVVRATRKVAPVEAVSVELVPPHTISDLEILLDTGIGSLVMSIELWDDSCREKACPGKSYISKAKYQEAWAWGVDRLGRGRVSSVLLIGLEEEESTAAGIDAMTHLGVIPTLIPFRPYDGIPLSHLPAVSHDTYQRLSRYNREQMVRQGLSPRQSVGCANCGGCSLDIFETNANLE